MTPIQTYNNFNNYKVIITLKDHKTKIQNITNQLQQCLLIFSCNSQKPFLHGSQNTYGTIITFPIETTTTTPTQDRYTTLISPAYNHFHIKPNTHNLTPTCKPNTNQLNTTTENPLCDINYGTTNNQQSTPISFKNNQ